MSLTRKYNVTFAKYETELIATYHNNSFKKLEYKKGGIARNLFEAMGKAVPMYESEIRQHLEKYRDKVFIVRIEDKKPKSQYSEFLDRYLLFHHELGVEAKINGVEGKALKQIITYLNKQAVTEHESYQVWDYLLKSWTHLDEFYQKQTLLRQINSNLTILLTQIKDGKNHNSNSSGITRESMAKAFFERFGNKS